MLSFFFACNCVGQAKGAERFVTLGGIFRYIFQKWKEYLPKYRLRWDMRVAICDEDRENCGLLGKWILKQEPDCEVMCFYSVGQFLEAKLSFDILLLDIQMEGLRGMEIARALRMKEEDTVIVFVTAGKEYAAEAFEVSAFHYLLKPLSQEKFCEVFAGACREARRLEDAKGERLFFHTKTRNFTVRKKDILYVESARRQVEIHTLQENITVYAAMKHMEEKLGEEFYRCHRGYLVNLFFVAGYVGGEIRLQNGESVYLAREKYAEFVRVYTEYLRKKGTALV